MDVKELTIVRIGLTQDEAHDLATFLAMVPESGFPSELATELSDKLEELGYGDEDEND